MLDQIRMTADLNHLKVGRVGCLKFCELDVNGLNQIAARSPSIHKQQ